MASFEQYNLKKELLQSLKNINFDEPTEVQQKTIPIAMNGRDVIVRSKTGTGKTGAFLVPIIQMLEHGGAVSALIVVPTRELAIQVSHVAHSLLGGTKASVALVYGGASINVQIDALRRNPAIVIGTPGRLIDLMERKELRLSKAKFLVLDEADLMLDLGFMDDVEFIISRMPREKQVMLFSATMPAKILGLSKKYMRNADFIEVGSNDELTVDTISHSYTVSSRAHKIETMLNYIAENNLTKSIIFSATKRNADLLYNVLVDQGFRVALIHGNIRQSQREKNLQDFRKNAQFLVATNVAARGLDIGGISDIINFDIPEEPYIYVHRVGRSARMGADGKAFSIVTPEEIRHIHNIEDSVNIKIEKVQLKGGDPETRHSDPADLRVSSGKDRVRGYAKRNNRPGNSRNSRERHHGYRNRDHSRMQAY